MASTKKLSATVVAVAPDRLTALPPAPAVAPMPVTKLPRTVAVTLWPPEPRMPLPAMGVPAEWM